MKRFVFMFFLFVSVISLLSCSLIEGEGENPIRIHYSNNGAQSGTAPEDNKKYSVGDTAIVMDNTGSLAQEGCEFVGWVNGFVSARIYIPGEKIIIQDSNDYMFFPVFVEVISHTYEETEIVNSALNKGLGAASLTTDVTKTAFKTESFNATENTIEYHLNGYSSAGITLHGTISVTDNSVTSITKKEGFVNVTGDIVTKIIYNIQISGGVSSGTYSYAFDDGTIWLYDIATKAFTKQ